MSRYSLTSPRALANPLLHTAPAYDAGANENENKDEGEDEGEDRPSNEDGWRE